MGRAKAPALRDELLERATAYVLEHGLAGLSLRPLAARIGTNARMLVCHFGSKEALVAAILERATAQQHAVLGQHSGSSPTVLRAFWTHVTQEDLRPQWRLLLEIDVLGLHEPVYATASKRAFADWRAVLSALLEGQHPPERAAALATLVVGTFSGLLLDLVVTGDLERVNRAFANFAALLEREETP
jgi:AcrR family transcriptional regulator